jgi:hypothetical protein
LDPAARHHAPPSPTIALAMTQRTRAPCTFALRTRPPFTSALSGPDRHVPLRSGPDRHVPLRSGLDRHVPLRSGLDRHVPLRNGPDRHCLCAPDQAAMYLCGPGGAPSATVAFALPCTAASNGCPRRRRSLRSANTHWHRAPSSTAIAVAMARTTDSNYGLRPVLSLTCSIRGVVCCHQRPPPSPCTQCIAISARCPRGAPPSASVAFAMGYTVGSNRHIRDAPSPCITIGNH